MDHLNNHTDQQLTTLLRDGVREAFDEIYNRYWKLLFNTAFKRLGDTELCEDLVQEIFVDLWMNRRKKTIEALYPYLLTAVRYQVFTWYKKHKKLPVFEEPLAYMAIAPEGADSTYFLKELLTTIQHWLELQPEKRREIFRLRYLESLSTKEIAEELQISQKTVQNQLNTAQGSLRSVVSKLLIGVLAVLTPV